MVRCVASLRAYREAELCHARQPCPDSGVRGRCCIESHEYGQRVELANEVHLSECGARWVVCHSRHRRCCHLLLRHRRVDHDEEFVNLGADGGRVVGCMAGVEEVVLVEGRKFRIDLPHHIPRQLDEGHVVPAEKGNDDISAATGTSGGGRRPDGPHHRGDKVAHARPPNTHLGAHTTVGWVTTGAASSSERLCRVGCTHGGGGAG